MNKHHSTLLISIIILLSSCASKKNIPFEVSVDFDQTQTETLGLDFVPEVENFTIFSPQEGGKQFNHGVVLFFFKDKLYAQWQSSNVDEDGADTQVFYSYSENGETWSEPIAMTEESLEGIKTSGGWWSYNDTLIAFINVWPNNIQPKGGYTTYKTSIDGIHWSDEKVVLNSNGDTLKGVIEQDIRTLPNGRILTAFHIQPGLKINPFYTDDPSGIKGWKAGEITLLPAKKKEISREIEPSWFYRKDNAVIMVFRDQNSTHKKLAAISFDNGETWTTPTLINTPDSRSKQSAGNLPNGTAFMINNPTSSKTRYPLVITLSKDGYSFEKAFLLRSGGKDLPPMRYEGKYKRAGYSYPKAVIWGDYLYVSYATNKEDVEITRIPIKNLLYH